MHTPPVGLQTVTVNEMFPECAMVHTIRSKIVISQSSVNSDKKYVSIYTNIGVHTTQISATINTGRRCRPHKEC